MYKNTGSVLERYEYDAYGNCYILEPNFADDEDGKSDYDNPYLFTGRRVDILNNGSLKLQYNRNRYYDQYTGRWLTHDPLGYADSMSLYEYVQSNPVNNTDPKGMYGTFIHRSRIGASVYIMYLSSRTLITPPGNIIPSRMYYAGNLETLPNGMLGVNYEGTSVGYEQAAWWLSDLDEDHSKQAWIRYVKGHNASKKCGPDFTDELDSTLDKTEKWFNKLDTLFLERRSQQCCAVFTVYSKYVKVAWDVHYLYIRSEHGIKESNRSVIVNDTCYDAAAVNYALYGLMGKLCRKTFGSSRYSLPSIMSKVEFWKNWAYHVPPDLETKAWTKAGYNGWSPTTNVRSFTPYHVPRPTDRTEPEINAPFHVDDVTWCPGLNPHGQCEKTRKIGR